MLMENLWEYETYGLELYSFMGFVEGNIQRD